MRQIIETLQDGQCIPSQRAIDDAMEVLYEGLRVLPSKDAPQETTDADAAQRQHELALAAALEQFSRSDTPCPVQKGRALNLKLFIEEISQVAEQLSQATSQCGVGDALDQPPCDRLRPLLGEQDPQPIIDEVPPTLVPGYSYFLRSPALAPTFRNLDEDTFATEQLSSGDCASVLKETKGMMLKATFEGIGLEYTVDLFGLSFTPVPVWSIEFAPAEFLITVSMCNGGSGVVTTTELNLVQDVPLRFFWRYNHR